MIIPAIIFYVVFCYLPMYGIVIAFQDYTMGDPIIGEGVTWAGENGLGNFERIFNGLDKEDFYHALTNTVIIGISKLIISFVAAVVMALLINEIRLRLFKKTFQTVVTFPHFLSWVIVGGLLLNIFGPSGIFYTMSGSTGTSLMENPKAFLAIVFGSDVWKEAGWSSIIYLATMAGISPELYEAADIDGATRFQKIWHITLPAIKPTAILLLILSVGGILNAGFDQLYNLGVRPGASDTLLQSANILDTYIYSWIVDSNDGGVPAAVGLFKSVVSFILVLMVDRIAKLSGERGII